jgi:hypothetical protein
VIRPATISDAPTIARLGAIFHQQAGWDEIPYNETDCATAMTQFIPLPTFLCFLSEQDGLVVGMVAGMLSPTYFNHSHITGEELFWWVSADAAPRTGVKLLTAIENRARELGGNTWNMKSLARLNGERMEQLYTRRGYRASERLFIKEL